MIRVERLLDSLEHLEAVAIKFLHQASKFQADAVMFIDDAAIGNGCAYCQVPDPVVQRNRLLRIRRNMFLFKINLAYTMQPHSYQCEKWPIKRARGKFVLTTFFILLIDFPDMRKIGNLYPVFRAWPAADGNALPG